MLKLLHVKAFTYRLIHVLNFCASLGLLFVNFPEIFLFSLYSAFY